jgi:hypothetical protein
VMLERPDELNGLLHELSVSVRPAIDSA